eukprot:m.24375 g.24375  ORF g.24375 m.24375 type:complete len:142 (-) comp8590_c0_seq1:665-1090(-)
MGKLAAELLWFLALASGMARAARAALPYLSYCPLVVGVHPHLGLLASVCALCRSCAGTGALCVLLLEGTCTASFASLFLLLFRCFAPFLACHVPLAWWTCRLHSSLCVPCHAHFVASYAQRGVFWFMSSALAWPVSVDRNS